jgi:molybdopterin molybdotransferase
MITRDPPGNAATPDQVIAKVRACARALDPERVDLQRAAGRVLSTSVTAPEDQPPFDRSAMDGYAIRIDDQSMNFRIVDRIRAGDWKLRELGLGEAAEVGTGGALPCDGLQVVIREEAVVEGDRLTVARRDPSRYIRFRGEDAKAGQVLIQSGTRLTAGSLALLASLGETQPRVTRLPRVFHLATGEEIVSPDQRPSPGQIRDSNTTLVRAFLAQWGIEPTQCRVGETLDDVRSELRRRKLDLTRADLLLISGGASVGQHDITGALLEELGYTLLIRRTTTRPGKPMIFGARGSALAFGLPGNPLAHFVCLHLYVRQALEGFSGSADRSEFLPGQLDVEFNSELNSRETLWPARLRVTANGVRLTPLPWRSSGDLTSLATTNALLRIPPSTGTLEAGAAVQFIATSPET